MRMRSRLAWAVALAALAAFPAVRAEQGTETRPARDPVEGVWKLVKIVRSTGSVDTRGGFIFQGGYYSTTVGTYSLTVQ